MDVRAEVDRAVGDYADLDPIEREQAVRIPREAIVNAVRHGGARNITVVLGSLGSERLLRVVDDGQGMQSLATRSGDGSGGFGIPTMRARAETVGGSLEARAGNVGGTEVEVLIS